MTRAFLFCPGRGSYTEASLRSLDPGHPRVQRADALRTELGLEPLTALDGALRFEPARHLRPAHVAPLIYTKSMLDVELALARHDVVAVGGNSMGWYTALAAAGALDFDDGFRLVQRMALLQEEHSAGGQVIYPVVDEEWRPDEARREAVRGALDSSDGDAMPSIVLGGFRVLAGTPRGVAHLLAALPRVTLGRTQYPFRLAQHGPYHTPLVEPVAAAARAELADLGFRAPATTLIDGRGRRFTPWSADARELRDYTLGVQVTEPYDVTASIRVVLREHAPERIVLPGPGNSLGGVVGQVLVEERWAGIDCKSAFSARQASGEPFVDSMSLAAT